MRVTARGLHHPEGVAVCPDGTLVCGSDDGRLFRVAGEVAGGVSVLHAEPGALFLGVLAAADGSVLACELTGRRVVRVSGPSVRDLPAPDGGWRHPNALCAAPGGGLFVTDSGRWSGADGRVGHVRPDGTVEVLDLGPLAFANGVCLDADGLLCVVESADPAVSRWDGAVRVARHPLPGRVPDGVAGLADGSLLVACYRPDSVLRVLPSGEVEVLAADPTGLRLAGPTNVACTGADRRTAVVANFGGYHLTAVPLQVPGLAPAFPAFPD